MSTVEILPEALTELIRQSQSILADVIKEEAGNDFYRQVTALHQHMIDFRKVPSIDDQDTLLKTFQQLAQLNQNQQHAMAHSFTLMIELINACEVAYRTHRLNNNQKSILCNSATLVFVLTAHPTEARSPANITLFQHIQQCCLAILQQNEKNQGLNPFTYQQLKHWLKLAWLTPVAKHMRPQVLDEAESIFSVILRQDILDELILQRQSGIDIRIRTWVGGDKDGHPGVNEKVMISVMACARKHIISVIKKKLYLVKADLTAIGYSNKAFSDPLAQCMVRLKYLAKVSGNDGLYLTQFKINFNHLSHCYQQAIGSLHPELKKLALLLEMFPALIIPLELREDASVVHQSLTAKEPTAISRMLIRLNSLCHDMPIDYYIKGLILSMTQSSEDIVAGIALSDKILSTQSLRIVPLFETESALNNAHQIVTDFFNNPNMLKRIISFWDNKFEIMLGYSDSSKGMGVLASKLGIANAMQALNKLCHSHNIQPLFFHGSGGSVDRGGGSIEEQTSWWPQACFAMYKTTLQGEMVERSFASRQILHSMVSKLQNQANIVHGDTFEVDECLQQFAADVSLQYQQLLKDPQFLKVIAHATSYRLLDKLKFGSRPAKRSKAISVESLRAIPWVLCWTQSRVLLPTWWGIGSTWQQMASSCQNKLQDSFINNPLFGSYMKLLGFTLTKVDLPIWQLYLQTSELDPDISTACYQQFKLEFELTCKAVKAITKQQELLWFRPWLQQSIELRAPMIHPLNLLQIHAIKNNDAYLIRETTTGIASGMLTTG